MGRGVNLNSPSDPVVVESVALVPSLVRVTVAPRTCAPEASVTVPRMAPVSTWARRAEALRNRTTAPAAMASAARRINLETAVALISCLLGPVGPYHASSTVAKTKVFVFSKKSTLALRKRRYAAPHAPVRGQRPAPEPLKPVDPACRKSPNERVGCKPLHLDGPPSNLT